MKRTAFFISSVLWFSPAIHTASAEDPRRIEVTVGAVTLLLREETQWTPGRIDFLGKPMTTEKSAYGTVFSFPDIGFIGTAHLENEPEEVQGIRFFLDGQEIDAPGDRLSGNSFRFERQSRVRTFDYSSTVELRDNRLYESVTLRASKATPQNQIYHFMHAWVPTASAYLAGTDAKPEERIAGKLTDEEETLRRFYIQEPVDWMAIYDPVSGQFAVSRLLEAPEEAGNNSQIWNVPPNYRKYYLKCFQKGTVPAGFEGAWKMVTAFGESNFADWETKATRLAAELKTQ